MSTLIAAGCGTPERDFSKLADEFVYTTLAFSPIAATAAGLHRYQGRDLDEQLDDVGTASLDHQREYYQRFRERLHSEVKPDALSAASRADLHIMQDQAALALLDLDETQSYLHNPTLYVEMVGNALFTPFTLEYAPLPARIRHIIARLQKLPLLLDQARTNLLSSPDIWTKVAAQENEGNIALIDKTIRAGVPADQRAEFDRAARPALDALRSFQDFLQGSLALRNDYDWRLGRDRYTRKFRFALATGSDPSDVLELAARSLEEVRARMLALALPLHRQYFPNHPDHADLAGPARENLVISEVLDRVAGRHSTPANFVEDARRDLEEARQFVARKHLLTLPPHANLQVIPTPEFMRGIYAVGGFNPAPALEPRLGAFYWITPIPAEWDRQRVESKLREYNFYKLKLLTLHEAIPGHYVQFEYANEMQPASRRLLRALYGNTPYIEGWAQYATQTMLDEGFLDHSPELRLTFQKEELRVIANAMLDISLQMLNMTDQEALDLMQKETFQEAEEATAKLQRAKLSSAQLPAYFVGWRGWLAVREKYRQAKGSAFRLPDFHDAALKQGAVPLPELAPLLP
ncbi:MAG TPA: DUF885 domain-containing protein [Bryobacteraceae bacterium]|nr:DUF885 domain-containing protein [Bryobacteraceae bacterium]